MLFLQRGSILLLRHSTFFYKCCSDIGWNSAGPNPRWWEWMELKWFPVLKHQSLHFIAVITIQHQSWKITFMSFSFPSEWTDWILLDSVVVRLHAFGVGVASSIPAVWRRGPLSRLEIDEGHHATARRSQDGRSGGRRHHPHPENGYQAPNDRIMN